MCVDCHTTHDLQVSSAVPVEEPLFQPFPNKVTFQGYEANGTYTATLALRNNDKVGTQASEQQRSCQMAIQVQAVASWDIAACATCSCQHRDASAKQLQARRHLPCPAS